MWNDNSKWIWVNSEQSPDTYGEFYSEFDFDGKFTSIRISADSNYTLMINGKFVQSGQYADFPYYKVYDTIDITDFCQNGKNQIAIIVWYYGIDSQVYYKGNAALRFEVYDCEKVICKSDENVYSRISLAYKNGIQKLITRQLGFSFIYDATMEDDWLLGNGVGFEKSVIVMQDLPLYERPVKKLDLKEKVNEKLIKSAKNRFLFDLCREEVGFFTIKVKSLVEQTLTIAYGEHIKDGEVRRIIDDRDFSVQIKIREGTTEYTNYFRRLGLRYLEVFSEDDIDIEYVSVLPCEYPLQIKEKKFDNELHQKIYDISVRTLKMCMHEHYEDCPWREQALYTMDSRNQMLCGYYAFEEFEFPRANLYLFSKDNRDDNLLSIFAPCGVDLTIPSFSLHYYTQIYEYMLYSKDYSFAEQIMPKLESLLLQFTNRIKDGIIPSFTDKKHWNFYEWTDGLDGELGSDVEMKEEAALNCLLSIALQNMQKICDLIGKKASYGAIAYELNSKIRERFFDESSGLYVNVVGEPQKSELCNSLAVLCGASNGEEAEKICETLHSEHSLTKISLSMMCFKYDALLKIDKDKYKNYVIKCIEEIYSYMIDEGATTFWETIKGEADFNNAGSLCHGWSAMPIYYFNILL